LDDGALIYAAAMVLIGFQAATCAVFWKASAVAEGFLADDALLERVCKFSCVKTGLALLAAGLAGSIWAVCGGETLSVRAVIASVLAMTLGMQVIFSSYSLKALRAAAPPRGPGQ
jgi:hypothetical protein